MAHRSFIQRRLIRLRSRRPGTHVIGAIEAPKAFQRFSAWIDIRGWAASLHGSIVDVDVIVNGQVMRQLIRPTLSRPDVAEVFPRVPGTEESGFEVRILREELGDRTEHLLEVIAECDCRRRRRDLRTLATIPLLREEIPLVSHSRGDYKQVWDDEVKSDVFARIAVCGTDDLGEYDRSGILTAQDIVAETGLGSTSRVLEIGCGSGRVGAKLAPSCGHWTGADVSKKMIETVRQALAHLPNVSFVALNGADLAGVESESLDVVYCTGVFMHLDEWDRFRYVEDSMRVLKPGGALYFDNFNLLSDDGWTLFLKVARHDPATRPANISKSSTPDELKTYAERAGFADIRIRTGSLWVTVIALKQR